MGRTDQGIVAIFELEVRRQTITAQCSCGEPFIVERGRESRDMLADWLFDHARCPEVEVCR